MRRTGSLLLLDNTVLSNFTVVEQPELVRIALGAEAATVDAVWQELVAGMESGALPFFDWAWLPKLTLTHEEKDLFFLLQRRLNRGEAACLAVAAIRGGRVFTDDWDARQIASEMRIPVSGTLGILMRLVDIEHFGVKEADQILASMIGYGYFSPVRSLRDLL